MLYSNLDLLYILIISLFFVAIFKIQRALTPLRYFSNADIVIESSVSIYQVIVRYILIGIFSITIHFLFNISEIIIILGNFLGAFLIIWPVLLSPKFSYETYIPGDLKLKIYILHILFVISSILVTYLSLQLIPLFASNTSDYISNILMGGGGLVFNDFIKNILSKKIRINAEQVEKELNDNIAED